MTTLQKANGALAHHAVSELTNTRTADAISVLIHDSGAHWLDFPSSDFNTQAMEKFVAHRLEREPLSYSTKEQRFSPRKLINGILQSASGDSVQMGRR
jgi:hypothetical protein